MGCACGGKRPMRNVASRGQRPVVGPQQRAIQGGLAAARTPTEIRAFAKTQPKPAAGLTKERRLIEKKRRDTIMKKFQ